MNTNNLTFEFNVEDLHKRLIKPKKFKGEINKVKDHVPMYISILEQGMAEKRLYDNVINPDKYKTPTLEIRLAKYGLLTPLLQESKIQEPTVKQEEIEEEPPVQIKIKKNNVETKIETVLGISISKNDIAKLRQQFSEKHNNQNFNKLMKTKKTEYYNFLRENFESS
jgi:hypothetical protein